MWKKEIDHGDRKGIGIQVKTKTDKNKTEHCIQSIHNYPAINSVDVTGQVDTLTVNSEHLYIDQLCYHLLPHGGTKTLYRYASLTREQKKMNTCVLGVVCLCVCACVSISYSQKVPLLSVNSC